MEFAVQCGQRRRPIMRFPACSLIERLETLPRAYRPFCTDCLFRVCKTDAADITAHNRNSTAKGGVESRPNVAPRSIERNQQADSGASTGWVNPTARIAKASHCPAGNDKSHKDVRSQGSVLRQRRRCI